jgi:hypothetical protein
MFFAGCLWLIPVIATQEADQEDYVSKPTQENRSGHPQLEKYPTQKKDWRHGSNGRATCKHEALSSNPSMPKINK